MDEKTPREKLMWLMENSRWPAGETGRASEYFGTMFRIVNEYEDAVESFERVKNAHSESVKRGEIVKL